MGSFLKTYALGFLAVVIAVLVRWLLDPVMGDTLPLVTLFAAVAAAVWLGGYRVAIPVALIGFVLYLLIRGHEKAWNVVLHILAYWGILTAGSLFIAWVLMVILV